ncbi:uncharacterized protein [Typha latifolia]|uniref:uncharacterized protein n=1 Tax=Typha latifolia TaxID=4733 RepID=UPI003C30DEF0
MLPLLSSRRLNVERLKQKKNIISSLPLKNHVIISSQNRAGGLWLLWDENISLEIIEEFSSFIFALIKGHYPASNWILGCVYGNPYSKDNALLWHKIGLFSISNLPLCCIGDYNCICNPLEKEGGAVNFSAKQRSFVDHIANAGLLDLGFSSPAFTWSNRRTRNELIRERLDRALASPAWSNLFPSSWVLHLPAISSDHNPLLLDTSPLTKKHSRKFRTENWWFLVNSFRGFCRTSWDNSYNPNCSFSANLSNLASSISCWKKEEATGLSLNIKRLEKKLLALQAGAPTEESLIEENCLRSSLEDLYLKEEIYWKQRARNDWLTSGDRNTKFFHASASSKHRRNSIFGLKLASGHRIHNPDSISLAFVEHFKTIFSSSNPLDLTIAIDSLLALTKKIPTSSAKFLSSCPSEEEIESVVKSFGPDKAPGPDGFNARFFQAFWEVLKPSFCNSG